jgi:alpha-ketoglutarate-dependent 2,4-dichlorophenoxyacetate dioxygenase
MFLALQNWPQFGDEQCTGAATAHPGARVRQQRRRATWLACHRDVGWSEEEGRRLLDELFAIATQPRYVYSHRYRKGDLVIWDNRCTMHSATAFERYRYRRDVRRTTINESGPEVSTIQKVST